MVIEGLMMHRLKSVLLRRVCNDCKQSQVCVIRTTWSRLRFPFDQAFGNYADQSYLHLEYDHVFP